MAEQHRLDPDSPQTGDPSSPPLRTEREVREIVRHLILELAPGGDGRSLVDPRLVEDLGFHSLALMELAFALEDEFKLRTIDEEAARKIVTLADVVNHVVGELAATERLASAV